MGLRTTGLFGKIFKIVILCVLIYLLLYGFQLVMDFLNSQTDQPLTWWEIHKLGWIKYPLFAIVIYLVLNETI